MQYLNFENGSCLIPHVQQTVTNCIFMKKPLFQKLIMDERKKKSDIKLSAFPLKESTQYYVSFLDF